MFMDKDFLLNTDTARKLYHDYAKDCPIIDYHCHLNPKEIYDNIHYDSIMAWRRPLQVEAHALCRSPGKVHYRRR